MTDSKKILVLVIPISFVFGVWWGLKMIHHRQTADSRTLKVLTFTGLLDAPLIEALKKEIRVELEVVEVDSSKEWEKIFVEKGPFDLLAPMSFQAETLIGKNRLAALESLSAVKHKVVAADFCRLPFDPEDRYTFPLFWGAEENALAPTEASSEQKETQEIRLWLQLLAVDARSSDPKKAFAAIEFFSRPAAIQLLASLHPRSLPFQIAESSELHPRRKPSHLRTLPLTRLRFYQLSSGKNLNLQWRKEAEDQSSFIPGDPPPTH